MEITIDWAQLDDKNTIETYVDLIEYLSIDMTEVVVFS
jgi:hypothetical protein